MRICFWNVAGLTHLNEDTWEYLEEFDVIGLTETWTEKKGWRRIKDKMSNKFSWNCIPARREYRKGRAKGDIIIAVNKSFKESVFRELSHNIAEIGLKYNGNRWRIVTVYSQDIEENMNILTDQIHEEEEEYVMIGGDYNARTGNEGGPIREDNGRIRTSRDSRDKEVNKEGRILIREIEERGWMILNGSYNKEGGWTYIGETGTSVVDYVIANEKAEEIIRKVDEGDRTESDHVSIEVELEGPDMQIRKQEGNTKVI